MSVKTADANHIYGDSKDKEFFPDKNWILGRRMISRDSNPTLYHYCTPATAVAVLQTGTLRFSDITHLNDAEERIWGENMVFYEALARIREGRGVPKDFPAVEPSFFSYLEAGWKMATDLSSQFAVCFSTNGDSLSQWRAYAADGEGFALGFRLSEGVKLPFAPLRVEYDLDQQLAEMFEALSRIWHRFGNDPDRNDRVLVGALVALSGRSIAFKNPAFREELEIRLGHTVVIDGSGAVPHLRSTGVADPTNGNQIAKTVQFEARRNLIVPFIDISFRQPQQLLKLVNVNMGPKCRSRRIDVERMLGTLGYEAVDISTAGAAYR